MSETKIRFAQNKGHTVLYNVVVRDRRLSLKTVGLLAVMKSLENTEWEFSVSGMAAFCRVGKDAIRGCLKELEDAGYLVRERTHNEDGTFAGNEYIIFETSTKPVESADLAGDDEASHHRRKNPTMDKTQRRQNPSSDNPTQIKEITQVKENNIPPISPTGQKARKGELDQEVKDILNQYVGTDKELGAAMVAFMDVRSELKAKQTERAVNGFLGELDKLSAGDREMKIAILRQSEKRMWKFVFPLKDELTTNDVLSSKSEGNTPCWGWQ